MYDRRCRLKHSVDERDLIARQREDFVSRLTHDLRTPLVAADRMLTLFQEGALGELPPTMGEAIDTMIRSNQNLLTMVNLLLEVYRYEAGRKTLNFTSVSLPELVQAVIAELLPLATEKKLALMLHPLTPENDPTAGNVWGDRLELRRVVTNLLGNAIKFTDAGSVAVRLTKQVKEGKQQDMIVLTIEDTGAGIPIADQAKLFESFMTGNHRRSGSGLGLHLSRQIVEAHQGEIRVQSEVGKGSIFTVRLPMQE